MLPPLSATLTDSEIYDIKMLDINDVKNNVKMSTNIEKLMTLGLSRTESLVYLALFDLKKASALEISKTAGVKRPTTYLVLESLRKKGLVKVKIFRSVKDYQIQSLGALKQYIKKQKVSLNKVIPKMLEQYTARPHKLRLRVYHNISSLKTLLEKSLREKERMYIFGDKEDLEDCLGDYWRYYEKRSSQLNMRPKFKSVNSSVIMFVWADKISFFESGETIQLFAFRNTQLADLFKIIWKQY